MRPSTNSSLHCKHPGAHAHGSARRAEEKDARKTHRQFHARAAILDGRGTGGEGLQRAIEEHRMQRVFAGAGGDRVGQRDAAGRVTRARGEFANRRGIPRRSAAPDRSCSDRSPRPRPARCRVPPRFPKSSRRRAIPCARRASSRRRAATTPRLDRSGSGSRTCARWRRRKARDARPRPGRAG